MAAGRRRLLVPLRRGSRSPAATCSSPAPRWSPAVLIWESGLSVGQYGTIFVWATLISAYFFSRRTAAIHLAWLLLVYAGSLALVESTGGYSPVTRWIFTAVSLTVVMLFVNNLVARRDRADIRARHFFDLSQDMLCTMDTQGRCIEVNGAWQRSLGYRPGGDARQAAARLHPPRRPRPRDRGGDAGLLAAASPRGSRRGSGPRTAAGTGCGPARSSSPKRSSSTPARPTSPSAKLDQEEREELIAEVQMLARSDALTGLPNRRALDDQLPREMARALRTGIAALPGDHRHRPLQGLQRHPRPPGRRRGAARLRRRLGLASCAAKTRSCASAARSSSSSCPTASPPTRPRSSSGCAARRPTGRPARRGWRCGGRGRASTTSSPAPTRLCTRPRRRARPARQRCC